MFYDERKKQSLENARLEDRRKKISEERQKKERKKAIKNLKKYSTGKQMQLERKKGEKSLMAQVSFFDFVYFLALIAAILKDILDLSEATGLGYILVVISTFLVSIFIGFMLLLASFLERKHEMIVRIIRKKIVRICLVYISGFAIELIPGLDILPIETLMVLIIYALVLTARKKAKKQIRQLYATQKQ